MCMCLSLIAITQPNNHLRQKSLCAVAFGRIAPEFLHTLRFRDRQERHGPYSARDSQVPLKITSAMYVGLMSNRASNYYCRKALRSKSKIIDSGRRSGSRNMLIYSGR